MFLQISKEKESISNKGQVISYCCIKGRVAFITKPICIIKIDKIVFLETVVVI